MFSRTANALPTTDPEIWAAIFRANCSAVLDGLQPFTDRLDEFRRLLASDDGPGLVRFLSDGKQVRDAVGN